MAGGATAASGGRAPDVSRSMGCSPRCLARMGGASKAIAAESSGREASVRPKGRGPDRLGSAAQLGGVEEQVHLEQLADVALHREQALQGPFGERARVTRERSARERRQALRQVEIEQALAPEPRPEGRDVTQQRAQRQEQQRKLVVGLGQRLGPLEASERPPPPSSRASACSRSRRKAPDSKASARPRLPSASAARSRASSGARPTVSRR